MTFGTGYGIRERDGIYCENKQLRSRHRDAIMGLEIDSLVMPKEFKLFVAKQAGRLLRDSRYLSSGSDVDIDFFERTTGREVKR